MREGGAIAIARAIASRAGENVCSSARLSGLRLSAHAALAGLFCKRR